MKAEGVLGRRLKAWCHIVRHSEGGFAVLPLARCSQGVGWIKMFFEHAVSWYGKHRDRTGTVTGATRKPHLLSKHLVVPCAKRLHQPPLVPCPLAVAEQPPERNLGTRQTAGAAVTRSQMGLEQKPHTS